MAPVKGPPPITGEEDNLEEGSPSKTPHGVGLERSMPAPSAGPRNQQEIPPPPARPSAFTIRGDQAFCVHLEGQESHGEAPRLPFLSCCQALEPPIPALKTELSLQGSPCYALRFLAQQERLPSFATSQHTRSVHTAVLTSPTDHAAVPKQRSLRPVVDRSRYRGYGNSFLYLEVTLHSLPQHRGRSTQTCKRHLCLQCWWGWTQGGLGCLSSPSPSPSRGGEGNCPQWWGGC